MIAAFSDLTPEALAPLGFEDPVQACHVLREMAGRNVPDALFETLLGFLLPALTESADPDRAAANFGRWAESLTNRMSGYRMLTDQPIAVRMLTTVFAASQFFAEILIQNPEYLEILLNPAIRDRGRDLTAFQSDLARRVGVAGTPNARRDALRRFKAPEILRIGVRDLLGYATMPETAREISDFADACLQMALTISREELKMPDMPFAAIAMGKLGGQELNYASDIDLIFVHGDEADTRDALRLADAVQSTLERVTSAGFVFRVDLRLRPEGRFGPASRSLTACKAYYESWAEPWERQALLKARFAAGSAEVGDAFIALAHAFVYRPRVEEAFVESIQANKRRLEQKIERAGESQTNVKEGVGGIRDIEFLVQLLQLIAGGQDPKLQTGNTLAALPRLAERGLLREDEAEILAKDYQFLRTVEHRLQILDERPVRDLPTDLSALRKFGRRLGFPDGADFRAEYDRRTGRVHALFQRLFYGENGSKVREDESESLRAWSLSPDDPAAQEDLRAALAAQGFSEPDAARAQLKRHVVGSEYGGVTPEAREEFAALLPALLEACAATEAPDAALQGISALADAMPSRAALFHTLRQSGSFLPRLCRLAASSPYLWQILLSHLEYFDLLADDEAIDQTAPSNANTAPTDIPSLAGAIRRTRLRIGARDLWELADTPQILEEWTQAADWALEQALQITRRTLGFAGRFAIIGMGKLGGRELGYGSDWDVLFLADSDSLAAATRLAEQVQRIFGEDMSRFGLRQELDARLRPDGQKGALVLDIAAYRHYYAHSAATWEQHALIKARPAAGNPELGQAFQALTREIVYGQPWTTSRLEEIRAMKRRIENERVKDPRDLKLAPGGMADIEWTAQIQQIQHGAGRRRLQTTGTLAALRGLRDDVFLTQSEWETLSETYLALIRLRNRLYLRHGVPTAVPDIMPDALRAQMKAVRAIALHRLFGLRHE